MTRLAIVPGAVASDGLRALVLTREARSHPTVTLAAEGAPANAVRAVEVRPPPAIAPIITALRTRVYRVHAPGLAAGARHTLSAAADGVAQRALLRTLPDALPDEGFTLAIASCYYRGYPLHAQIAAALRTARLEQPAAALLLLGDNLYIDEPAPSGRAFDVVQRYVDHLFDPGYGSVRALLPTFTTWDDHEFWNDFPEPQFHLPFTFDAQRSSEHRAAALACLELFQGGINPDRVQPRGRSYGFPLLPLRFFVADMRTQRSRVSARAPAMLQPDDLDALEAFLLNTDGPCVVCLGQPLWMPARSRVLGITFDHNPPAFPAQYARIWNALRAARYDVLLLAGDVHYSRLLRIAPGTTAANRVVWECVSSPLCHLPSPITRAQGQSAIADPARA